MKNFVKNPFLVTHSLKRNHYRLGNTFLYHILNMITCDCRNQKEIIYVEMVTNRRFTNYDAKGFATYNAEMSYCKK